MAVQSPRYPSTAELDAYAQKTANSPLSIKIFPTNVRVPQHKHLSRTVNGFDTTAQRYDRYLQPGAYKGLLTIFKVTSSSSFVASSKAVVKNAEGRRTKLSPGHASVAPYQVLTKASETTVPPNVTVPASVIPLPGTRGLNLAAQSNLPSIRSIIYQINQHCQAQALQQISANPSPCKLGMSSGSGGSYTTLPPQGSLGYLGQNDPVYSESLDYILWQKHQHQQAVLRMYSGGSSGGSKSPESSVPPIISQGPLFSRTYPGMPSSSPMNCAVMPGGLALGQYLAPPWNSVLVTPESDCYNPQDLPPGATSIGHVVPHYPHLHNPPQHQAPPLSSSLRSLEFLINDIRPPCIKEQMLGRSYESVSVPRLLDHQHAHIRLPVYR